MLKDLLQKRVVALLLFALFILFFCLSLFSEGTFDAGDGIRHYLVSRYCWSHPDLLLYSWGKPFFTIVSSPFSQFGLLGINVFNILCGVASAYLAYKIAQPFKLTYALLAIPFLLFTPSYFPTLNSGLTEPFFGLILILSIYLVVIEKYSLACIVVSFLPFIRTEGNLILPLFFILLLYRRKWLSIPLLAFGTLAYSVIGYFYYHDFLWVKNQNPYNGENKAFYGSGELLHFVNNHNFIWGSALGLLFVAGLAAILIKSADQIKAKTLKESLLPEEIILIYGSFVIYFVAHSIMWWKGMANSLGLLRVIAGVVPCSALICLRGLNFVSIRFIRERKIVESLFIAGILIWVIRSPFKHDYFPFRLDPEQALVKEAGDWYKTSPYTEKKVYYLYPYLAHVLNIDSFDPNKVGELWGLYPSIKQWGIGAIPDSTVVFWDAHFGPNECHIPLDTIMNDPNFQLVKTFKPQQEFTTLGGYKFEIYAFLKLQKPKQDQELSKVLYDLEENKDLENTATIINGNAFSGRKSCRLVPGIEYSATLKIHPASVPEGTRSVRFKSKVMSSSALQAQVVFSVDDPEEKKNLYWEGKPIVSSPISDSTEWKTFSAQFNLPTGLITGKNTISVYVWNKAKETFTLDDLEMSYWGAP